MAKWAYLAGKVIILSIGPQGLTQLPRNLRKPMGLAVDGQPLAVAAKVGCRALT